MATSERSIESLARSRRHAPVRATRLPVGPTPLELAEGRATAIVAAYLERHGYYPTRADVAKTIVAHDLPVPRAYLTELERRGWLRPESRAERRARVRASLYDAMDWPRGRR
jgi:hypothetical protein